jgi:Saxitoxin biosynthesis operon protein SxtJ
MQWSDVVKPPPTKMLRQFAGLCLVVFVGLAGWRAWRGHAGTVTWILAAFGAVVGGVGLVAPQAIRWVYTTWMIVAFPIGWTISRLMLLLLFYGVFTPIAFVFRLRGRDPLRLRARAAATGTYWQPKPKPATAADYFRQS